MLPLQAAEWLVWEMRIRFEITEAEGRASEEDLYIYMDDGAGKAAFGSIPTFFHFWDREQPIKSRNNVASSMIEDAANLPDEIRKVVTSHWDKLLD